MPGPRRDLDAHIAQLAAAQAGVFTRQQALDLGMTHAMARRRVTSGIWRWRAQGVYGIAGFDDLPTSALWAATLAPGVGAVVSHQAAAQLHGLPTFDGHATVVTVPHSTSRLDHLATVHQSRRLYDDHITSNTGLRVTTVARTIIDLASEYRPGRIEIVLDRAVAARKTTLAEFCATFDDLACRGRRGIALVRAVLAERRPGYVPPASVAESMLLRVLRLGGLPRPVLQFEHPGRGYEGRRVDAAYPAARILIEVDSRTWHGGWTDRERDLDRDLAASAVGFRTLRISYKTLTEQPDWLLEKIRGALAAAAA
jgi:very-short-patch-repair endonuclease/predicted transcriptional regulator of viral defense system